MSAVTDIVAILCIGVLMLYLMRLLMKVAKSYLRKMELKAAKELNDMAKRKKKDAFLRSNGYSWDFVIAFKVYKEDEKLTKFQQKHSMQSILRNLNFGGLETKMFFSVQNDEVFCKIRASPTRLENHADQMNFKVLLSPVRLKNVCLNGKSGIWRPFQLENTLEINLYDPYEYIYAQYEVSKPEAKAVFTRYGSCPFKGTDRIKIIRDIIQTPKRENGCGLDLSLLIKEKTILGAFPLHDKEDLVKLQKKWLTPWQAPWAQPIDQIKDYFGEKIGLYFVWLGHYTTWLIFPSLVGLFCWFNVAVASNNPNAPAIPYFTVLMSLWATFFLEFWKRKESRVALMWGMSDFEQEERSRPQFQGDLSPSPITGQNELYFPRKKKFGVLVLSWAATFGLICAVIGAVAGVFVLQVLFTTEPINSDLTVSGFTIGNILSSLINAIQIQVMNLLYGQLALKLTDFENHRTETEYEDFLIGKTFMFQFVNSYASLFYIAFIKGNISGVGCTGSCMSELQTSLGTIFMTRLVSGNLTEIGIPYVSTSLKKKAETTQGINSVQREMTACESEFIAPEYHIMLGTFNDYAEMIIQFGYSTLFVAAFPLAPLMAFINNYVEIRVDAWKLCQQYRRPIPSGAQDIGTWYVILEIMSTFAVVINGALFAFTGTFLNDSTLTSRIWYFILFEHLILFTKFGLAKFIPDVEPKVKFQLKRQAFLISKVIEDIADERSPQPEVDEDPALAQLRLIADGKDIQSVSSSTLNIFETDDV